MWNLARNIFWPELKLSTDLDLITDFAVYQNPTSLYTINELFYCLIRKMVSPQNSFILIVRSRMRNNFR